MERCGAVWSGVERCGAVWSGVERCGAVWSGVERCGAVWSGVERCGAETVEKLTSKMKLCPAAAKCFLKHISAVGPCDIRRRHGNVISGANGAETFRELQRVYLAIVVPPTPPSLNPPMGE